MLTEKDEKKWQSFLDEIATDGYDLEIQDDELAFVSNKKPRCTVIISDSSYEVFSEDDISQNFELVVSSVCDYLVDKRKEMSKYYGIEYSIQEVAEELEMISPADKGKLNRQQMQMMMVLLDAEYSCYDEEKNKCIFVLKKDAGIKVVFNLETQTWIAIKTGRRGVLLPYSLSFEETLSVLRCLENVLGWGNSLKK